MFYMSSASHDNMYSDASSVTETYLRDRDHLLRVFPEEVWFLILDKVEDSNVLEQLSNSSTFLRELLSPQRLDFLFPSVYEILVNRDYYACITKADSNWARSEQRDDVLNLRLVSRSWCETVDKFYQHHRDHFRLDQYRRASKQKLVDMRHLVIDGYNEQDPVSNFHYIFDSSYLASGRNPFFGRRISINISDGDCIAHRKDTQSMLDVYGHHIWHLTLSIWDSYSPVSECYSRIRALLEQLPNLKMLHIAFSMYGFPQRASKRKDWTPEIEMNPLPTFEKLEMLSTDSTVPPLFLELLQRNSHISTLAMYHENPRVEYDICNVSLPKMKTLSIHFKSETHFAKILDSCENWPILTELHLHLNWTAAAVHWQKVFDLQKKKFKNSLIKLDLTLPEATVKKEREQLLTETYMLDLPNLTHLQLRMPNLACLDFLLPMRDSLQVLHLDVHLEKYERVDELMKEVETEKGKIIKFFSSGMRGLDTNIWTLFPKLKTFQFVFDSEKTTTGIQHKSSGGAVTKPHWSYNREKWHKHVETGVLKEIEKPA